MPELCLPNAKYQARLCDLLRVADADGGLLGRLVSSIFISYTCEGTAITALIIPQPRQAINLENAD